jgi:M6 family metalloprotease-like protein
MAQHPSTKKSVARSNALHTTAATKSATRFDPAVDPDERPRSRDFGNLSVVSVPEAQEIKVRGSQWITIPGLATGVGSVEGDHLEISVSIEIAQPGGTTWIRALIDGIAAEPNDVAFKTGSVQSDGVRSFTFVQHNMKSGQHLVEIQMLTSANTTVKDRVLTVHSGSPLQGWDRVVTRAAVSGPAIKGISGYTDIPGMKAYISVETLSTMAIVFSAEATMPKGMMQVRALVNGAIIGEVNWLESGIASRGGTRSYTFVVPDISAVDNEIEVKLQWRGIGAHPSMGDRTMTISAMRSDFQKVRAISPSSPVVMKQAGWFTLADNIDFESTYTISNVAITVSSEVMSTKGIVILRATLDGEDVHPSNIYLIEGGSKWRVASHTFIVKNVPAGRHRVKVMFGVGPNTEAKYRRSTVRVMWKQRRGPDFVQPFMGSIRQMQPHVRNQRLLVIGFDPMRPGHPRPSFQQIRGTIEGFGSNSDIANLRDWVLENSGGVVRISEIRYVGCCDNDWYVAKPSRQGNWYWDNLAWDQMRKDALTLADADVDFHAYNTDNNNSIEADEVIVVLVVPQNGPTGTWRSETAQLDGKPHALEIYDIMHMYLSSDPEKHRIGVGVAAHEFAHCFGAFDLYGVCESVSPGLLSIMDSAGEATHLDPFHKMKNGWVHPRTIDLLNLTASEITLHAVELYHGVLLVHDAAHVAKEYFMIEYRYPGSPGNENYDAPIEKPIVVIWQIFEDVNLVQTSYRCPGDVRFIRKYSAIQSVGDMVPLSWSDNTDTNVWITVTAIGGEAAKLTIK